MVRFIMDYATYKANSYEKLYIPIWLDLLYNISPAIFKYKIALHSNMVRFIIEEVYNEEDEYMFFTFQYG